MKNKLVIVESPHKAKTIKKYLGSDFEVIASQGHIIDLPASKFAVDVDNDFKAEYKTMKGKAKIVKEIKQKAKSADIIYLATDPDREGEAIAWHLRNMLEIPENEKCRIEFNEITKNAVIKSVETPRKVDEDLVNAQQARRILDRIVGYKISPLLWKKVKKGLSAGRVQSVTLKIIVDRERQIREFIAKEYWLLSAKLLQNKDVVLAKFYGDKKGKIELETKEQVDKIVNKIDGKSYIVKDVKKAERKRNPYAPFTTSSLQQEASRKLGFSVKKTMMVAQKLYEAGYITYMRTDSIRLSSESKDMAKDYIVKTFGENYHTHRDFKAKQTVQDAHEAIRPTSLKNNSKIESLGKDEARLYSLIVNRFLASQMSVAIYNTVKVTLDVEGYIFNINGSTIKFDGFMRLYTESRDESTKKESEEEEFAQEENILPEFKIGDVLKQKQLIPEQKFTEPPPRYTEASLVKALEEKGIGRPSTYAPTISTLEDRLYIEKEKKTLFPTKLGEIVNSILENNFKDIVDVTFTADMENKLDMVALQKQDYIEMLSKFYIPFIKNLEEVQDKIEKVEMPVEQTDILCELCGKNMVIKEGRYGKFLACPGYPDCKNAKPIVNTIDIPCPTCGGKINVKKTKKKRTFYVCENNSNTEDSKCDYISWNKPKKDDKKDDKKENNGE